MNRISSKFVSFPYDLHYLCIRISGIAYEIPHRHTVVQRHHRERFRVCGQDRPRVQDGHGGQGVFPEPSAALRQEPAYFYVGELFLGAAGTVPRIEGG